MSIRIRGVRSFWWSTAAEIIGGTLEAGDECLEVGLFAPGEIPWQELAFPSTREAVGEYVERYLSKV